MHFWCGRRNVHGSRGQHERNQGMSKKHKGSDKATIPKNIERDARGKKGIARYETMHCGTANGNCTNTQGRTNNVPLRDQRSGQRGLVDGKRFTSNVDLLCQSCPANSGKVLTEKSIEEQEIFVVVEEEGHSWMTPLFEYLMDGTLPEKTKKTRAIKTKARQFGLPREIISDNGKQFKDNPFKNLCEKLNIKKRREKAKICEAISKSKMEKYYNAKVRSTTFRPRDFVYRSNEASHVKESGKLGPKWEGPYEV
ncbi:reverse transcriptase domain-containing protein, partial [Tanacetum coccineum]